MVLSMRAMIIFSSNLEIQQSWGMGRQFERMDVSLPGLGMGVTMACFQTFGKWPLAMQWLKSVTRKRMILGEN